MGYEAARNMSMLLAAMTVAATVSLVACYLWGRLIGRTARRMRASRWRAYVAALFPIGALAVSLIWNQGLTGASLQAFFGFGSPAIIGAFQRWHYGGDPEPMLSL